MIVAVMRSDQQISNRSERRGNMKATKSKEQAVEEQEQAAEEHPEAPLNAEGLQRMLQAEKRSRVETCGKELDALMTKYNCRLSARVILGIDGVQPIIDIIAK